MSSMTDDELIKAMSVAYHSVQPDGKQHPHLRAALAAIRPHLDALRARAEQAEAERDRLRTALAMCRDNDKTFYNHHEPRRDGRTPDENGDTIWLTPREIARAVLEARDDG